MNPNLAKYCKKVRVDLTDFLGDSHFVEVREPTTGEVKAFFKIEKATKEDDKGEIDYEKLVDVLDEICGLLPQMITDHDFFDGTNKLPSKDVAELVASDFGMTSKVVMEVMHGLPLMRGNGRK